MSVSAEWESGTSTKVYPLHHITSWNRKCLSYWIFARSIEEEINPTSQLSTVWLFWIFPWILKEHPDTKASHSYSHCTYVSWRQLLQAHLISSVGGFLLSLLHLHLFHDFFENKFHMFAYKIHVNAFFPLTENPYRQLPCDCHSSMTGKTAVELGPLWYVKYLHFQTARQASLRRQWWLPKRSEMLKELWKVTWSLLNWGA